MSDDARQVAFNPAAPADERQDAQAELTRVYAPRSASGLFVPPSDLQPFIDYIEDGYRERAMMAKAARVIPFPGRGGADRRGGDKGRGMQSVYLDELQVFAFGDYFDRPSPLGYESLRMMVEATPILNAVIMTRARQVQRFSMPQDDDGPGFTIRHVDPEHQLTKAEQDSITLLRRFIANCGWEFNPRRRKRLRRSNFAQFLAKCVRESLTYDSMPIEVEMKADRKEGIDGLYAVDGSTIRLCTDEGYEGDDEVQAVQVINGRVVTAYTYDDLIYEPRNPRADVRLAGYGLGETELLVRVVTGFLNAMAYNSKGFDENSMPKGVMHLTGEYSKEDLVAFRRYWNSMVHGVNNAWSLPVMVSRDAESKATFERFGIDFDEMHFAKWMTFLISIICAVYGMSPSEINFDSFTGGSTSALSGSDTAEKLAASKDSGLRPLMAYMESIMSDYVVADFSEKFVFRWTGLDEEDQEARRSQRNLCLTVNEIRALEGYQEMDGPLGEAPINPSLVQPWLQLTQGPAPGDEGAPGGPADAQGGPDGADQGEPQGPQAAAEGGPQGGDVGEGEDPAEPQDQDDDEPHLADLMQPLAKANPYHGEHGLFSRAPEIRYEKRKLHELYDFTLKNPLASSDAMLVRLNVADLAFQVDKGPAVEKADGQIRVTGRKGPGRGHGMVKILWKHGQRSGKPDGQRVTRGDVLALPEVVRSTPSIVVADAKGEPRAWEWRRTRFDGATVVYAASRFSDTDNLNHIVTVHVDAGETNMKKAAVCAAGDLFGRTPQLPADAVSVPASAVGPLTVYYCQDAEVVKAQDFGKSIPYLVEV